MSSHTMNGDPMDDWRFGFEVKSAQIGAAEVGQGVTYTIDRVDFREIGEGRDAKMRPVIGMRETDLDWVTCKTTLFCVEAMFGRSPREWIGKRITLYWDAGVKFGRDTVGGVRVAGAPGIRGMTVKVKLPKRGEQKIPLVDTAPKGQISPAEAREKLLEFAAGKGVTPEQIDAFLSEHGTSVAELGPEALRRLAKDLDAVKQHAAEQGGEAGGEWDDAEPAS